MTVTEVRRESVGEEKEALKVLDFKIIFFCPPSLPLQHGQVADWLYKCEKTLDFFFDNQPDDITEEAVAQAEHEEV